MPIIYAIKMGIYIFPDKQKDSQIYLSQECLMGT